MSYFFISAAHKSSGKTTLSIGMAAALCKRGLTVQTFKKGPDYIDPLWLAKASGRGCENLDFYTTGNDEIIHSFQSCMSGSDVALIEGNKGLYDGLDLDGSNSNAALAELLDAPVILVLNAQGMTRGIAPLILGYQAFAEKVRIAGVILNRVGGSRHEGKLCRVIEHYTDVEVVGAVANDSRFEIEERHLGLLPSNEAHYADDIIETLSNAVSEQVDLDKVLEIANTAKKYSAVVQDLPPSKLSNVRIGIAQDDAFGFYYYSDRIEFEKYGAELIPFSPIHDSCLPDVDALFIGGGFPETHLDDLSENKQMRSQIKQFIEAGKPVYAECGGLMYLSRSIQWSGDEYPMVAVIPADCVMHSKPQGRGYVQLATTKDHPWDGQMKQISAHEFHYSELCNLDSDLKFAFDVMRGTGINGKNDGLVYKNLLANYTHQRHTGDNQWVHGFVDFVRKCKLT